LFSALVGEFSILAHAVGALLHGKGLTEGLAELASKAGMNRLSSVS